MERCSFDVRTCSIYCAEKLHLSVEEPVWLRASPCVSAPSCCEGVYLQICSQGAAVSLLRWDALQGAPSTHNDDGYAGTSNNYFKTFSEAHKGMHPERNSAGDLVALAAEPVCKRLFGRYACF